MLPEQSSYRLSLIPRILVVVITLSVAVLTALGVLPLSKLMGVDPSQLQGAGFEPSLKVMSIVILYSLSQFVLIWIVMRFVHKKPFISLFRRPFMLPLLIGTGAGIVIKAVDVGITCLLGSEVSLSSNIPPGVSLWVVVGYFLLWILFLLTLNSLKEELVFRAYPIEQFNDQKKYMPLMVVLVSLVFAAIHHIIEPFSFHAFISRFMIALLFSYVYVRTRSIWLVSGIHNGVNFLGFFLGAGWKSGGLLHLSLNFPSPAVGTLLDVLIFSVSIVLFHFLWKKNRDQWQSYFNRVTI